MASFFLHMTHKRSLHSAIPTQIGETGGVDKHLGSLLSLESLMYN